MYQVPAYFIMHKVSMYRKRSKQDSCTYMCQDACLKRQVRGREILPSRLYDNEDDVILCKRPKEESFRGIRNWMTGTMVEVYSVIRSFYTHGVLNSVAFVRLYDDDD